MYSEVNIFDGTRFPARYETYHWFSSGSIKQGDALEFRALSKQTGRALCFSGDTFDIRQTELNFGTAYSPRGRPHPVTSQLHRLEASFRNRAWVERPASCQQPCAAGIPECTFAGTQNNEVTGTVPGSATATLPPGCYVMETYWEYGPSPPPRGVEQRESGSLPQFCVERAPAGGSPPGTPAPGTPPPGTNPGTSTGPAPTVTAPSDFALSCGTTRFNWHYLTKEPTFVKRGEYACVVLLSNRLSRELIDIALQNRWSLTQSYVRTHWDAIARSAAQFATKFASVPTLQKAFPVAAQTIARLNRLYAAPSLFGYGVVAPLAGAFVLGQYTQRGACAQFIVDVDKRRLRADWSIVYNPRVAQPGGSFASVWELKNGKATRRYAPLRCGLNGRILLGRGDAIFSGATTKLVVP